MALQVLRLSRRESVEICGLGTQHRGILHVLALHMSGEIVQRVTCLWTTRTSEESLLVVGWGRIPAL